MRIPAETVQQVQQTADIVEVVSDFVALKKRGANYIACCPFHNEKTPSFNVNPVRGIYKCFGCGKAGDSVRFVMDIEGIGFPEAIRFLAKKYGIEIKETELTPDDIREQNERESLYIALNFAKNYYQNQLFDSEDGRSIGLSYFKERGFIEKTIREFELGYSPSGWDTFSQAALKQGFTLDILEKAGLTTKKEDGRLMDRFRARVIFPIHNLSGKSIAFGARILTNDKNQPKYLNSPETEVYHKSNVLYGIAQAKQAIRQEDVCYLVEGYTDVLSLHQAGIHNVVASSGTSLTLEQIKLFGRFTLSVPVLYDGDAAGIKASLRGTDMILEEGLNVKVVVFPDGDDPDSFVRKVGGEGFKNHLRLHANDFITFKAELSIKEAGSDPFKRAEIIREMVESISKIPDSIKRTVFFQKTAQLMGIDESVLIAESNKIFLNKKKNEGRTTKGEEPQSQSLPVGVTFSEEAENQFVEEQPKKITRPLIAYQEEECVRLLVLYGTHEIEVGYTLTKYILNELRGLSFLTPVYDRILTFCRQAYQQEFVLETEQYMAFEDEEARNEILGFAVNKHQLSDNWKDKYAIHIPTEVDKLHDMAYTNILRLKKHYNHLKMDEIKQALAATNDPVEQERLLVLFMQMKNTEKIIAQELGTVVVR